MENVIPLPPLKSYIFVKKTPDPIVSLSSQQLAVIADSSSMSAGIKLFPTLQVAVEEFHDGEEGGLLSVVN